jgi:Flp pilus assembly protein TadD
MAILTGFAIGLLGACTLLPSAGGRQAQRGLAAYQSEDYVVAVRELEGAIATGVSDYDPAVLYTLLGNTYASLDRYEDAIATHQKALQVNPHYTEAWVNLGIAYRLQGDLKNAEDSYQKALDIDPDYPELHASLGALYIFQNDPERAIASLQHSLDLEPKLTVAHSNLALAYAMVGDFQDAETQLKQATDLGYTNAGVIQARIDTLKTIR